MFDHISEEGNCPNSTLSCQYAIMGCHEKVSLVYAYHHRFVTFNLLQVKRRDMNTHMSDAAVSHQQLLFENLVSLQSEQKKSDGKIKELQKANKELQSENSEIKYALKSLKENFSKQVKKLESSNDKKPSYDFSSRTKPEAGALSPETLPLSRRLKVPVPASQYVVKDLKEIPK